MKWEALSMSEIQTKSLDILKEVVKICEKLSLTYYLAYGSLLGAIRHKGFIPWDDDIDIMMPRPDYVKLISYFGEHQEELKPLQLFSVYNNTSYPYMITRISNNEYILDVDNEKPYGIGIFIDIYPMDGVGYSEKEVMQRKNKASQYSSLCFLSTRIRCKKGNTKSKLKRVIKFPAFIVAKIIGKDYFIKKLEEMSKQYSYDECPYVGCLVWGSDGTKGIFPKEWFSSTVKVQFEDSEFFAPYNYDAVLKRLYGDYMKLPSEENRIPHHLYTAYKK